MTHGDDASRFAAEALARVLIDRQLNCAGWSVQDKKPLNLFAAQGVAVREVAMKAGDGGADYVLYVDKSVIGMIEAMPEGTPSSTPRTDGSQPPPSLRESTCWPVTASSRRRLASPCCSENGRRR